MNINISKLDTLAAFQTGNENTIAVKGENGLVSGGTYSSSNIFRWMRSGTTQAANNAMRAELLRNLGEAFGLTGMGASADGKVTFSRDFMDQLEKLLGKDLNRSDFGIAKDGTVGSGKPLTQRRITAILNRARIVGKGAFDCATYRAKVDAMLEAGMAQKFGKKNLGILKAEVAKLRGMLDFLENDQLGKLVTVNPNYDPESEYNDDLCIYHFHGGAGRKPLESKTELFNYISENFNLLLHPEYIDATVKNKTLKTDKDVDFLETAKQYVTQAISTHVKIAVDMFFDTLGQDLNRDVMKMFDHPGALCVEGQTTALINFQAEKGLVDMTDVNAAPDAEPVNLAVADHTENTDLLECLTREAQTLENTNKTGRELGWDDYLPVFEKNLVGQTRPVQLEANGPVEVRPVTRDDILALRSRLNDLLYFD